MWYFERNYSALMNMLAYARLHERGVVTFDLARTRIALTILEQTRYTLLLEIHQHILDEDSKLLPDMRFAVRVYVDAQLAEVISYQGHARFRARYDYPNPQMFQRDEKRQANLLLHDWLSTCTRLNYKESGILVFQG